MKSSAIFKISTLGLISLAALSACGGSSSSSSGSSNISYTGAATVGDLVEFEVNGNSIDYRLDGARFGSASGSLTTTPVSGSTGYHSATLNSVTTGALLAGNLGLVIAPNVADIPTGAQVEAFITSLKNTAHDESDVQGKAFFYFTQRVTPTTLALKLESDNSFRIQPVANYLSDAPAAGSLGTTNAIDGCWGTSANGNYFNAVASSTNSDVATAVDNGSCNQFDFVSTGYDAQPASTAPGYYRFIIKTGGGRAGLIVDMADGTGFGIGLETELGGAPGNYGPAATSLTYSAFSGSVTNIDLSTMFDPNTGVSPFTDVVLNPAVSQGATPKMEATDMNCDYSTSPISCTPDTATTKQIDIHYNSFCYAPSGNLVVVDLPGMACIYKSPLGFATEVYNALIDDQDGYFFAVDLLSDRYLLGAR